MIDEKKSCICNRTVGCRCDWYCRLLCAGELSLGEYLLLGKGEEASGGRNRNSVVSDAMEALIGAIYLDGGFASAKEFVERFILNDVEHKKL